MGEFKIGEIVQLKSGGPKMTVSDTAPLAALHKPNYIQCQWFAGSKLESGNFHKDSLVKVTEEKKEKP